MFKSAIKKDLRLIATELNETVTEKMTILDLNNLICNSELYKTNPDQVMAIGNSIIDERRNEEQRYLELEKIKLERAKAELELQKMQSEVKSETPSKKESELFSLDTLVKSIRTLTVKTPSKPENWGLFFASLERAFAAKNVPTRYKAEILLNLLGEKASNIIIYLKDDEIGDYEKVKLLVLREYEPSAHACLEQFRKATKQSGETWVQFASRLITSWKYYLKLRKVSDFDTLNKLIVSDKLFQILDKESASHISIRQAEDWFEPIKLAQEVELYFTSRGKVPENYNVSRKNQNYKNSPKVFFTDMKNSRCILCPEFHSLYKCANYNKLSVNERVNIVKNNNLCFTCLGTLHKSVKCRGRSCIACFKRHHVSLCYSQENYAPSKEKNKQAPVTTNYAAPESNKSDQTLSPFSSEFIPAVNDESSNKLFTTRTNDCSKTVLLSTVNCFVKDEMGNTHKLRCILDNGSMSNILLNSCAERLGLKREKVNKVLTGLSDVSINVRAKVNATLMNADMSFKTNLDFLLVSRITDSLIPSERLNINREQLNALNLADENFDIPGNIDALLGAEIFYEILIPGQIYPLNSNLILQNSTFGYIVSGSAPTSNINKLHCGLIKDNTDLDKLLRGFWEIENLEIEPVKNKETIICEEHFLESHSRDKEGKYIVKMPLKENPECLGKSRDIAMRRLNSLWKKLKSDSNYLKLYKEFLNEYKKLNHMKEVNEGEEEEGMYFIPHLGVFRPDSSTTPLRVVFDASCPTTNGLSLNSLQYNGGVPQDDIFTIMMRFRKHIFAFTADVQKMYRMIWIHPDQRKLQRILWKEGVDEKVKTYELATVTYGTTSAPFLATRTLKQIAMDEGHKFPLAAQIILKDMYIDDVLTGAETLTEAKELQRQLILIFEKAGMTLHKWCSNSESLIQNNEQNYAFSNPEEVKTLGVTWNQMSDSFRFHIKIEEKSSYKKRDVLATIAKLFDPLGLLGPAITKAKIILQQLWLLKIDWHELLPSREEHEWRNFLESLDHLNDLTVARCVLIKEPQLIEIHGFSDASEVAYGAVVYLKSVSSEGDIVIKLMASKSRVSPIKKMTIPRLELCAALLLAKLIRKVKSSLQFDIPNTYFWCDSMIVLSWLKKESSKLKTFVGNRISRIQELTDVSQWRHVSSDCNPADLISRGMNPKDLLDCAMWWTGPRFLTTNEYPDKLVPETVIKSDYDSELKVTNDNTSAIFKIEMNNFLNDFLYISNNYLKLIRILSFIFRFYENCHKKEDRETGPVGPAEFIKSELVLVRLVQEECFGEVMANLKNSKFISKRNSICSLNPFLDDNNVLRVGGRLSNSKLNYDKKYPILLPPKHRLTELIVKYFHLKYLHSGPQALLHQIREKFWIVNGRNVCRKIVHNCVTCFKAKPQVMSQLMADLPEDRVRKSFPFNITGADYCGPFYIKYKGQRKGIFHKVYICIFICFVTKAIHLELVSDMTSESFIAALKRFVYRRGKCAKLYTDNAKNFVGANAELKKLQKLVSQPDETLAGYLTCEGIEWKFLPPRAPNFGGIWEAGVKSIKYYLKRVVGNLKLTYEEFLTVLIQTEGILNSRPLVPLSADIDDLNVLTPSHFLIGRPITSIAEPDLTNIGDNRLSHWQNLTKIMRIIWKKWSSDYLSNLQQRNKWKFEKENVKVGDLVVIKEDNLPPCQWSVGRICQIYPGKDLKIRVVEVKTAQGKYKRPISKLCLLPINS